MLSDYTFLETRIQRLLDGLIFVEKGLCISNQIDLAMKQLKVNLDSPFLHTW